MSARCSAGPSIKPTQPPHLREYFPLQMTALTIYQVISCHKTADTQFSLFFDRWQPKQKTTRMVQLPATAAIENVAACWVSGPGGSLSGGAFVRGVFCPGGLLSEGLMPVPPKFNAYTHRLGFLCLASQSDGQTNKKTKRQTRPRSSAGSRPPSPNFQDMQRWRHTTYFIQALYGSDPFLRSQGRKKPKKPILP